MNVVRKLDVGRMSIRTDSGEREYQIKFSSKRGFFPNGMTVDTGEAIIELRLGFSILDLLRRNKFARVHYASSSCDGEFALVVWSRTVGVGSILNAAPGILAENEIEMIRALGIFAAVMYL